MTTFTPSGEVVQEDSPLPAGSVRLRWYCGAYIGAPKWWGDSYEPDECGTEFYTDEDEETVAKDAALARCPECGTELEQGYDAWRVGEEG